VAEKESATMMTHWAHEVEEIINMTNAATVQTMVP